MENQTPPLTPTPEPIPRPDILPTAASTEIPSSGPEALRAGGQFNYSSNQPINPAPPELPKPKSKLIPILVAVLILVALGAAGLWAYQNYFTNQPSATPTPSPAEASAQEGTANWKTYTNSAYNFKHPSDWTLNDLTKGAQVETYYQPDKTKSVGSILIEKLDKAPGNISQYNDDKQIGGLATKCMSDPTTFKTWCYVAENKISILIIKDQDANYNKTLDQILSTFKFLEPVNSPSASPNVVY